MSTSGVHSKYDVIVLGGGAPGEHCAVVLTEGGARVAVVGRGLRGDCSLVATGRRPPGDGFGLETVGFEADGRGIPVDGYARVAERPWTIGDVNGIGPLINASGYEGDLVAATILGTPRPAHYDAVQRVVNTDPQAAPVGATDAPFGVIAPLLKVSRKPTGTRAYAESNGLLTLRSDAGRLMGAYGLGPSGEWVEQAALAIGVCAWIDVLRDTIKPFLSFSEVRAAALQALAGEIAGPHQPTIGYT